MVNFQDDFAYNIGDDEGTEDEEEEYVDDGSTEEEEPEGDGAGETDL